MADFRILVIDDDPCVPQLLAIALAAIDNLVVSSAQTGAAGLALAASQFPALIFLDYYVLDMDGLEILRRLRALETRVPIIALTGAHRISPRCGDMITGCDQSLDKPIDIRHLVQIIERFLPPASKS